MKLQDYINHPILPWLKLQQVPGVGPVRFANLIREFGSAERVLNASFLELANLPNMSAKIARNIALANKKTDDEILVEIKKACTEGVKFTAFGMEDYPGLLSQIADPPSLLYIKGSFSEEKPAIAIVGSREATAYGEKNAFKIAKELAAQGVLVISGLARGIDTAAHKGALAGGGETIAVLGSGLNKIYPYENRKLASDISESGALISPFPMEEGPNALNFPFRNRIISGLCQGVAVIEATERSGSLITARLAGEQGREVFAMPGNVGSLKSSGTHKLLREGACLIERAEDILNELNIEIKNKEVKNPEGQSPIDPEEKRIFEALDHYPVHIDELIKKTGLNPGPLSALLLKLEFQKKIVQYPGKYFAKS